jgi:hypothetical protein
MGVLRTVMIAGTAMGWSLLGCVDWVERDETCEVRDVRVCWCAANEYGQRACIRPNQFGPCIYPDTHPGARA